MAPGEMDFATRRARLLSGVSLRLRESAGRRTTSERSALAFLEHRAVPFLYSGEHLGAGARNGGHQQFLSIDLQPEPPADQTLTDFQSGEFGEDGLEPSVSVQPLEVNGLLSRSQVCRSGRRGARPMRAVAHGNGGKRRTA